MASTAEDDFQGTARFQVVRRIGAGGMGVVYEAFDKEKGARVALKTLSVRSAEALLRLKHEFRSLQDLEHPNLVSLGELISERGQWFFTMELVDGVSFSSYVQAQDLLAELAKLESATVSLAALVGAAARTGGRPIFDEPKLRPALVQLARGIQALHVSGKVHRDIKPSNILVTRAGRVVLLDFGLVKNLVQDGSGQLSEANVVGTTAYMAPEQAAAEKVGVAADWYSVGALLFECLTGRLPFEGSPVEILIAKQQREAPAPGEFATGLPTDLAELCMALLKRDPAERPEGQTILAVLGTTGDGGVANLGLGSSPGGSSASSSSSALLAAGSTSPRGAAAKSLDGPPFVGRAGELAVLGQAFSDARLKSVAVVVQGESGVGKSALVRRFTESAAREHGAVVLAGRCYERESVPFKAFDGVIDALSRFLAKLPKTDTAALLPTRASSLAQVFPVLRRVEILAQAPRAYGENLDPQLLRGRVFAALRELFARLADRRPVVIVIDDLQWADADSRALLSALLRPPESPPLLLVVTMRTTSEPSDADLAVRAAEDVRAIHVGRLPDDEARELVQLLAVRAKLRDRVVPQGIATEAGGHPLFIDELIRAAGDPEARVEGEALRLDDVLWNRVMRLEPSCRRLLELVVVAGRPMSQETAGRAAAMDPAELSRALAVLRPANLVRTGGTRGSDLVEPYHNRVREAVASRLSAETTQQCHARLALALEGANLSDAEALAVHWYGAGSPERAAHYSRIAAEQAVDGLAFERAVRLYRAAIDLVEEASGIASAAPLQLRLGDALASVGRGLEAAQAYQAAARHAGAFEALELSRRAAEQLLRAGHFEQGRAAVAEVLAAVDMELPPTSRKAIASLLWHRLRVRLRGLRYEERDATRVTARELNRIDVCWTVSVGVGMVDPLVAAGFTSRHLLLALEAGEPFRICRALAGETILRSMTGQGSEEMTAPAIVMAHAVAERLGQPHAHALAKLGEGLAANLQGRHRESIGLLRQAEELLSGCTGVSWERSTGSFFVLLALYHLGELGEMGRLIPGLLTEAKERGDLFGETAFTVRFRGMLHLAQGNTEEPILEARAALARWPQDRFLMQHWWSLLIECESALYAGEPRTAWRRLEDRWAALESSGLRRVQQIHVESTFLHGRTALAVAGHADTNPSDRRTLMQLAARDAETLTKSGAAWAAPMGHLLRAGAAEIQGRAEATLNALILAARDADSRNQALLTAAARRRRGEIVGGTEGQALIAGADAWFAEQHVVDPTRMVALATPWRRRD